MGAYSIAKNVETPITYLAKDRRTPPTRTILALLAALVLGALWPDAASAIPFTLTTKAFKNLDNNQNIPEAKATTNNTFRNCIVQEGCMGLDGLVFMFDNQNPPMIVDADANIPK